MAAQLGFGFDAMLDEQESAHLPADMAEAIPVYRKLIEDHDRAMVAADEKAAMAIRKEANRLAVKLNGGEIGVLGGPDAPGYVLMRETAAPEGTVPMWGQEGSFTVDVNGMPARIKIDGMLGICQSMSILPGFGAYAVDAEKPCFSETGYRSFLGLRGDLVPGLTPADFARSVIEAYIKGECKGRLRPVKEEYRDRFGMPTIPSR